MVQLKLLSGKKAGTSWVARRFPVRIGRSAGSDLQLEDEGVWDRHLELSLRPREGFSLATVSEALATVNGEPVARALLRNGDSIQLGSVRMQFWLAETRQGGLRVREWLIWFGIAAISLAQVGLVYYLLNL